MEKVCKTNVLFFIVLLLCLLIELPLLIGVCVKTLGATSDHCGTVNDASLPYHEYNPFVESALIDRSESDLPATNFPFSFLHNEGDGPTSLALAPDLNAIHFATYGPLSATKEMYPAGMYNSGEDIQSIAGVGWYPFVSSVRNKNSALVNYTGHFIANMLQSGDNLALPYSNDDGNRHALMRNLELLSIFIGSQSLLTQNEEWIEEYTHRVYPFGCRSTLTCQWMKQRKMKSYFSACLTLTSMYEGNLLSGEESQYNTNMNALRIINPTNGNYTSDLQNARKTKDLILFVDVVDLKDIPQSVQSRARRLSANIPKSYPNDPHPYIEKIRYCHRLLSQYKNYAKVIVTSRIHVGLPAAAVGIPVIFVSKSGWLPGGHERTGRVAGLLDVFHRVDKARGYDWTFGNLSSPMPPNPGNHLSIVYLHII